jgi:tetratricopeptide (TPR) repeat protein
VLLYFLFSQLGAFCVEGPEPRPFSSDENVKLKEYAAKAVEMMVERRKNLRDRLAGKTVSNDLLRHASVATNLGDTMFHKGDSVTAMQLFQESVQTVMHQEEGKVEDKPNLGRHAAMADLLKKLSDPSSSDAATKTVMDKVRGLFPEKSEEVEATKKSSEGFHPLDGIPCLFNSTTKLKGMSAPRPLPPLVFADTFTIDLSDSDEEKGFPLDERQFTVSIGECSKATLFNMGLIHYYWCRPDTALQFFHLAASVSYKFNPLKFDPVDLTSANNMAQIYLQMRKPEEAKKMMASTLKRGNDLLSDLYKSVEPKTEQGDAEPDPESLAESMASDTDEVTRKTRRLRRKLARTLLNLGHVHFFNGDLDAAMKTCKDAIPLLDGGMVGLDLAASWFNMAMIFHYLSKNDEAISAVNRFLDVSSRKDLIDGDHVQKGDALQLKGECLYELGRQAESLEALTESLRIRRLKFGESSGMLVETLGLLGKVYLARNEVEPAITSLTQCLTIERSATTDATSTSITLSFEASQILLDLGRAHQSKGDIEASLSHYLQVLVWARSFFGATHVFVSRIATIVGNLYAQAGKLTESQQFLTEAAIIQASSG